MSPYLNIDTNYLQSQPEYIFDQETKRGLVSYILTFIINIFVIIRDREIEINSLEYMLFTFRITFGLVDLLDKVIKSCCVGGKFKPCNTY